MLRPRAEIKTANLSFDFLTEIEIVSSWENFTDKAEVKLPSKFKKGGETIVSGSNNLFKRGESITVDLGYFPNLTRVFNGFIAGVKPDSPLSLKLENEAYLFKQKNITTSFEKISLAGLMAELSPIPFETVDAELGSLRLTNVNFAQVLDELRETYGLVSFCRNGKLYVGLAYWPDQRVEHKLSFQKHVISSDLEYMRADDVKIKVKAISMKPDNKKIEVEVGDPEGAQKTMHFYNLDEKELRAAAERELPRLVYEGYRGTFTTFGEPVVKHGDGVTLTDLKFPEREGTYLVDQVTTRQSVSGGYRQEIKLGPKI
jgi:hypothetical protein